LAWNTANLSNFNGFDMFDIPANSISLWISPGKGMLLFSPLLLLSLLSWPRFAKTNSRLSVSIITTICAYTFFYAANFAWHGSPWCWGPRYLVPIVPLLMLPLSELQFSSNRIRLLVFPLVIISILIQLLAVSVDYRRYLLTVYDRNPSAFILETIIYEPKLSPILGQVGAFREVFANLEDPRPLQLYIAPGPWTSEKRPASIKMMLEASVDLNSFNFWWARFSHITGDPELKKSWITFGVLAVIMNIFLVWKIWFHIRLAGG
jgi:hypothetical protein